MTKAEIVDEIAERTGLTKKDVADTVDQFLEAVSRALASGKHIEIRGFGTFKVKDRKSRLARNPRTGESVPVPPRRVPVFKVSKELRFIPQFLMTKCRNCTPTVISWFSHLFGPSPLEGLPLKRWQQEK